ncbi:hypothetical protein FZC33_13795 [Labrys sp. KNU-23]|uniref:hypothetical protein n=1 Tax=Labrys sp. KNU-23 TaxID=2789216 RepID=UPI0011EBD17E|nr:hypothetical protein [Labrys sp. KNU-23]QEN87333.1 hypothetical protein FZC33_13795 [Labrys sp. KNU-23]
MWPFRRKTVLAPEMMTWMFGQAEWLLTAHAHHGIFATAQLLPLSERLFPTAGLAGHALAEDMFARVRRFAGIADRAMTLAPLGSSGRYNDSRVQQQMTAAGLYQAGEHGITIHYDMALLANRADLVAVLAHEVGHAILDLGARRPPPGDEAFEEMRTDFTAVFLGFGFYLMQFRADTRVATPEIAHAWKDYYAYYMNLPELCFATALFCTVRGIDKRKILGGAPGAGASMLKRCFQDLERQPDWIEALHAMAAEAGGRSAQTA